VTEAGQIQSVTRGEAKEGYALTTFAQIFSLSRQALINDDLGAFSDWAVAMGNAAAETEANQLVTLLISNSGAGPTMNDGNALFSTAHSNLATSGALPSISTLGGARQAMRQQTGLDGVTPINATPKFILVNPALETAAQQVLWQTTPNSVDEVNPFGGALTLLVEPRLTANAWYLFADPATLPCIEYGHLASAPGPQLASRSGWDTLGVEFRCVLDFGCGAIEHRGAYRNPGQ
jgi:phage major head subunit gpT-like protein